MYADVPMDNKIQPFTSNSIPVLTSFVCGVDLWFVLCSSNSYPVSIHSITTASKDRLTMSIASKDFPLVSG